MMQSSAQTTAYGRGKLTVSGMVVWSVVGMAQWAVPDIGVGATPVEALISFATGAPEVEPSQIDRVLYVDPNGVDSDASGTEAAPYRTIGYALGKAGWYNANMGEGIKVHIASGIYLEGAVGANPAAYVPGPVGGKPIVIEGAGWSPGTLTGDVIVTGAEPLTGWVDNGDGTWTTDWPHDLGMIDLATVGSPSNLPEAYPKRNWLFVDGKVYYQFSSATDPTLANRSATEGAFWVDTVAGTLTAQPSEGAEFAMAVATGSIEATTRTAAFRGWRNGDQLATPAPIVIRNIHFKRFGEYALQFQNHNGLIIEDCAFTQCRHYGIVIIDGVNNTLRRLRINDNGVTGFMHEANNALAEDIELSRNGRQAMLNRFLGWGYGGMKIGESTGVTYRRWEVRDNEGVGVWFDTALSQVDFTDSVITGSKTASIFVENNNADTIADLAAKTTLWLRELYIADSIGEPGATDGKGIQFAASENVIVEDCVIYNCDWLLNFPGDDRGPQRNIQLRRNIIAAEGSQPIYHVAYGTNGWREGGQFSGIEGAFDTFSALTNDNAYFSVSAQGFLNRDMSTLGFSDWKIAHLGNAANPNEARTVDSRSTFASSGYSGEPLLVVRPVAARRGETDSLVSGFHISRVANTLTEDLTVGYTVEGTAVAGIHYSALPGVALIPAGSRSVTVPLTLLDNGTGDPGLTLGLKLAASPHYHTHSTAAQIVITERGDLLSEVHGLRIIESTGMRHLEFQLRRHPAVVYPPHAIEASVSLQPDSWTTLWSSDGLVGTETLREVYSLEDGYQQWIIRDPAAFSESTPRFLRLRQDDAALAY